MIELPESRTLSLQASRTLAGRTVDEVIPPTSPHKFTWYNGDPEGYHSLLSGKRILSAGGYGAFVELDMEDDTHLLVGDGVNMRYYPFQGDCPIKHQLAIVLSDGAVLVFTVAMYGGIYAYRGNLDNPYYQGARSKVSPLEKDFDEPYFEGIVRRLRKDVSVKALLAAEQRIPGLGNGVLQDILFNCGIHPRCKVSALNDSQMGALFLSLKETLAEMAGGGGRDTEKDFFGVSGGYKTLLSKNTYGAPCPYCGGEIVKEAYMGGTVYYCPRCQKYEKR